MENKMEKIYSVLREKKAYQHAISLLSWDNETEMAEKSFDNYSETMSILYEKEYNLIVNDEFKNLLDSINCENLSEIDKKVIEELKENTLEMYKVPKELFLAIERQVNISNNEWNKGKEINDYSKYKMELEKLIKLNKEKLNYLKKDNLSFYEILLDKYEPKLKIEVLDEFFSLILEKLSPVIKKITEKKFEKLENAKEKFYNREYDVELQKKLSKEISEILGFDYKKGVLKESLHPFTTTMNNTNDVRITTKYDKNNPLNGLYSTIHETGHGIYEQNIDEELNKTYMLNAGVSMGIHETQSRMYENMICKNREFTNYLYNLFVKYFEIDKNGIDEYEFYLLINEVNNSIIRVDSDELTYPIHIAIRYELEKEIYNSEREITGDELKQMWDDKYFKYLCKKSDFVKESIMQDVHWSSNLFGYFPSYALGSAYAAQIYKVMQREINIDELIKNREFNKIKEYLTDKIFKYGALKEPNWLIENICQDKFDPNFYVDYLIEKYTKIYEI